MEKFVFPSRDPFAPKSMWRERKNMLERIRLGRFRFPEIVFVCTRMIINVWLWMTIEAETENLSRHRNAPLHVVIVHQFLATKKSKTETKRNPKRCVIIHNFKTIHCMFWAYPRHHRFLMFGIMLNQSVDIVLDKILGSLRYRKEIPTVVKLYSFIWLCASLFVLISSEIRNENSSSS